MTMGGVVAQTDACELFVVFDKRDILFSANDKWIAGRGLGQKDASCIRDLILQGTATWLRLEKIAD